MLYEKRLLVLGGSGSGCVKLERSTGGISAVLTVNNIQGGDFLIIVRDDSGLLTFVPGTLSRPFSFTLPESCELSRITVIVASGDKLVLSGTLRADRLWQGNLEDEIRRARKLLGVRAEPQAAPNPQKRSVADFFLDIMTPESYDDNRVAEVNYYHSNLSSAEVNDIAATMDSMPPQYAPEPPRYSPEPPPQYATEPPQRFNPEPSQQYAQDNYNKHTYDDRPTDYDDRYIRDDRNRSQGGHQEQPVGTASSNRQEPQKTEEPERPGRTSPYRLRGMPLRSFRQNANKKSEQLRPDMPLPSTHPPMPPPEKAAPMPEQIAVPESEAPITPPPPIQPPPVLGSAAFYDTVRPQLEKLFAKNEHYGALERLLPESKWIRIDYDNKGKFYLVGLIGEPVRYICYGVPGKYSPRPPSELAGYCQWLAIDESNPVGEGFWVMYQDAFTGKSVL